jgi:glycerophosphoryl diester phosphodiesterase
MQRRPHVIAHRGYTANHPENSLGAVRAALEVGAPGVEIDIQFTRDGVPVLLHDADLQRMTGERGVVSQTDLEDLRRLSAHEPGRLGERHRDNRIATLEEAVQALADAADVTVFVEIKRDSLPAHRIPAGVQEVLKICRPLGRRLVIISFDPGVLQEARSLGEVAVGWVLPGRDAAEAERAQTLAPDYLFADKSYIPAETELWEGPWLRVIYEVNDVDAAKRFIARGAHCIETAAVPELLQGLPRP